jgi:hypothetical protein
MKKKRFTDEQIGYALRQVSAGKTARGDLARNWHQPADLLPLAAQVRRYGGG